MPGLSYDAGSRGDLFGFVGLLPNGFCPRDDFGNGCYPKDSVRPESAFSPPVYPYRIMPADAYCEVEGVQATVVFGRWEIHF